MALYWRVRELGQPERWNAKKLAETTGLAYTVVRRIWANESTRADFGTIERLAAALEVEPGDLIGKDQATA